MYTYAEIIIIETHNCMTHWIHITGFLTYYLASLQSSFVKEFVARERFYRIDFPADVNEFKTIGATCLCLSHSSFPNRPERKRALLKNKRKERDRKRVVEEWRSHGAWRILMRTVYVLADRRLPQGRF